MRFTIRDLFTTTLIVGLALGWRLSADKNTAILNSARRHAEALRVELSRAEHNEAVYVDRLAEAQGLTTAKIADRGLIEIDWTLADKMIP